MQHPDGRPSWCKKDKSMTLLLPATLSVFAMIVGSPTAMMLLQARLPGLRLLGFLVIILVVLAIVYVAKRIVSK